MSTFISPVYINPRKGLAVFSKLGVVKFIASGIVGVGTGKILSGVIKNHVTPDTLLDKVTITTATWVISGIATTATKKYTNETIDDAVTNVAKLIEQFKTASKLSRINKGESTIEEENLDENLFEWTPEGKLVPKKTSESDQDVSNIA